MTTPKQIEANRQNARRFTGPRTPHGKVHVSLHATRHGLYSSIPGIPGDAKDCAPSDCGPGGAAGTRGPDPFVAPKIRDSGRTNPDPAPPLRVSLSRYSLAAGFDLRSDHKYTHPDNI